MLKQRFIGDFAKHDDDSTDNDQYRSPNCDNAQADVMFIKRDVIFVVQSAKTDQRFFLYLAASLSYEPCKPDAISDFIRGTPKARS